jgi:hypothetical protein
MARLAHPLKYAVVGLRGFFGGHSLVSGLNYFVEFLPAPEVTHPVAGPFIDAMTNMGLFDLIKLIETAVGLCLLSNLFVPLALVVEMPISFCVFWNNVIVVHSERSVITGLRELLANGLLLAAYLHYYRPFLTVRAPPWPLWQSRKPRPIAGAAAGRRLDEASA